MWTFKITKVSETINRSIDVNYQLLKDGEVVSESMFQYDASQLGLFNKEHILHVIRGEVLKHAYPEIAKKNLAEKLAKEIGKEMEFGNADIDS